MRSEKACKENDIIGANKLEICLITQQLPNINGGHILVSSFLEILKPLSNKIFLITSNFPEDSSLDRKIHVENVKSDSKKEVMLIRSFKFILMQSRLSLMLIKISKRVNIVIFFIGGGLLLPMLSAKLLRKRVLLIDTGSGPECAKMIYEKRLFGMGGSVFYYIIAIIEIINYYLSDKIVVYSEGLAHQSRLKKYKNKLLIAHRHFLDFSKFLVKKNFDERQILVGYIGRLSEEKGVLDFVKAIPEILNRKNEIRFIIVGDGQLRDKIEKYLAKYNLNDKVNLEGWIPHDKLPDYLNELKLVVSPSYTEGLPSLMLEAMACGTPVLVTPVGAIPDIIKDGESGFIMECNSPACIAENVVRALEHPYLERIVDNARAIVEKEFTYEAAVEKYREILDKSCGCRTSS